MPRHIVLILALCAWPTLGHAQQATPPITTASGQVVGVTLAGISAFKGIPFAAPPVGELRWQPPRPPATWAGLREAKDYGPACAQTPFPGPMGLKGPFSEDCLTLNVWSPALKPSTPAPVMFWIHGGSARVGSGSDPMFDGTALTRQGVVVVTINYRLDRLGLFAHPDLTKEQKGQPLGNYGLMDMVAALQWVKANIAAFGGDPNNVTIFGESSGSIAVTCLMTAPSARGFFHRAIAQSGVGSVDRGRYLDKDNPPLNISLEQDGVQMAASMGIGGPNALAQLRALPVEQILAYTAKEPPNAMVPVIDGVFLPMDVGETFAVGKQAAVPLLIGTNSWEEVLTARRNVSLADVVQTGTVDEARAAYPGVDDKTLAGWWFADTTFHAPSRYVAAKMERVRQPAYVYYMTYVAEAARGKMPGVPHGADIPYVFDNLRPNQFGTPTERDQAMAMTMSAYWVQFAKTGDPNGGGRPVWPGYTAGETNVLDLGEPIRVDPANLRERMAFHLARLAKVLEN